MSLLNGFKVGDKVRVVSEILDNRHGAKPYGHVGVIVNDSCFLEVNIPELPSGGPMDDNWYYVSSELELVEKGERDVGE